MDVKVISKYVFKTNKYKLFVIKIKYYNTFKLLQKIILISKKYTNIVAQYVLNNTYVKKLKLMIYKNHKINKNLVVDIISLFKDLIIK